MTKESSVKKKNPSMNNSTLPLCALHLSLNPLFFSSLCRDATDSDSFIVAAGSYSLCVCVCLCVCACSYSHVHAQGFEVCVCCLSAG